jgi:hypothetical protein
MKVAQYEVLGNDAKRDGRPGSGRDDRNVPLLVSRTLSDCQHWSIVPFLLRRPDYGGQAGTDNSLRMLTQPGKIFGAGLLSTCPSGTACLQP